MSERPTTLLSHPPDFAITLSLHFAFSILHFTFYIIPHTHLRGSSYRAGAITREACRRLWWTSFRATIDAFGGSIVSGSPVFGFGS